MEARNKKAMVSLNGQAGDLASPDPVVELRLTLNVRTGQFSMTGPIHDKVLAYGLLQMGLELVSKQTSPEVKQASRLAVPPPGVRVR